MSDLSLLGLYFACFAVAGGAEKLLFRPARLDLKGGDRALAVEQNKLMPLYVLLTGVCCLIAPLDRLYLPESLPRTGGSVGIGLAIFGSGVALRGWAIRTLGRHFTWRLGIRDGHALVTDGPYRVLRHPSYTGGMLLFAGTQVVLGSAVGLVLALIGFPLYYRQRIADEEAMLAEALGAPYTEWQARTWRMVPGLW